jgi:hypothetical protein
MMMPLVETLMFTIAVWLFVSAKVAWQLPAATPVTVNFAVGPVPVEGEMVAMPLQVFVSPNDPV